MGQDLQQYGTLAEVRAVLRGTSVRTVFVKHTHSSDDDDLDIQASKAAVLSAFRGMPGSTPCGAWRIDGTGILYLDGDYARY